MCRYLFCLFVISALFKFIDVSGMRYHNAMRETEYDYIIVGAGSAGSVVANRLSEDPGSKILLLEAGGLPNGVSEVPLLFTHLRDTPLDWVYKTEPQTNACLGLEEQRSVFNRGKVLGGSSTINGMLYVRGNPRDYDEWHKQGATGWNWENVLYYFKKSEDMRNPKLAENGFHGENGYLTISTNSYKTPIRDAFLEAGLYLGYHIVDPNSEKPLGFSEVQSTLRDGLRCSTEKAFLRPVSDKDNLDILFHAHVTQILFDDDKRAHSVRFEHHNVSRVVSTRKEVILCAGVIASPQLLMLSGVGPADHLQDMGIPVVADLPVGQNLNDHVTQAGQTYLLNVSAGSIFPRDVNFQDIGDLQEGKGLLTLPGSMEAMAFVNTKYQNSEENWPDIEIFFSSTIFLPQVQDLKTMYQEHHGSKEAISIQPMLCRPKSRGFIKLRSTNPFDHPIIDPRYLTEEDDLDRLVEGMKIVENIIRTPPLAKYGPVRFPEVLPGCENIPTESDDYLRCLARRLTLTTFHQAGTCKMGDSKDPTTVVDPELRVKGVKGLRVVDASIMPFVTSGNTNAPSIMIGEKGADMIRGRFGIQNERRL